MGRVCARQGEAWIGDGKPVIPRRGVCAWCWEQGLTGRIERPAGIGSRRGTDSDGFCRVSWFVCSVWCGVRICFHGVTRGLGIKVPRYSYFAAPRVDNTQ